MRGQWVDGEKELDGRENSAIGTREPVAKKHWPENRCYWSC
jgi:hypothetical protein